MGLAKNQPVGILTTAKLRESSGHIFCLCCRKQASILAGNGPRPVCSDCDLLGHRWGMKGDPHPQSASHLETL